MLCEVCFQIMPCLSLLQIEITGHESLKKNHLTEFGQFENCKEVRSTWYRVVFGPGKVKMLCGLFQE